MQRVSPFVGSALFSIYRPSRSGERREKNDFIMRVRIRSAANGRARTGGHRAGIHRTPIEETS
jgi:hypothetical protein